MTSSSLLGIINVEALSKEHAQARESPAPNHVRYRIDSETQFLSQGEVTFLQRFDFGW